MAAAIDSNNIGRRSFFVIILTFDVALRLVITKYGHGVAAGLGLGLDTFSAICVILNFMLFLFLGFVSRYKWKTNDATERDYRLGSAVACLVSILAGSNAGILAHAISLLSTLLLACLPFGIGLGVFMKRKS